MDLFLSGLASVLPVTITVGWRRWKFIERRPLARPGKSHLVFPPGGASKPTASPAISLAARVWSTGLLLLLMVAPVARGQKPESDLESLDLTGRVREMKESIEYRDLKRETRSRIDLVYRFNPNGPTVLDGIPVKVVGSVTFNFQM